MTGQVKPYLQERGLVGLVIPIRTGRWLKGPRESSDRELGHAPCANRRGFELGLCIDLGGKGSSIGSVSTPRYFTISR